MEAASLAILKALRHCRNTNLERVQIESDSKALTNIIRRQWKIPWQQTEIIEEIQELVQITQSSIKHIFREVNNLEDKMANEAYNHEELVQYQSFNQLSVECKHILNTDKTQIPMLRIKTRRIGNVGH
ncbi:hypothetical protein MTR67_018123 [Solanum verrucosum]|uniref:RNase H type-1 domain-containing protein n=1 Tax=Solanum verrucosum TaxID=315347 RepID=A0AAF0QLU7_SOLVR|nr:hypothetical protein MTR67_018123 [Solanum verrucosum]